MESQQKICLKTGMWLNHIYILERKETLIAVQKTSVKQGKATGKEDKYNILTREDKGLNYDSSVENDDLEEASLKKIW